MRIMKQHLLVTILILVTAFSSFGQVKKTSGDDWKFILDEIVISATRTETPYKELANSITVIRAEDIRNRQPFMLADILRSVPSIDIATAGGKGKLTSMYIRGAKTEHTLVMIDGIEANDPISPTRSFDFSGLTMNNIEKIEIIRGPQSTVYGSDAIAGVINIITRKGSGKPSVTLSSEGGSHKTISNKVGVLGSSGIFNYSINGMMYSTDGISAAKGTGQIDNDKHESAAFSAKFGIEPSSNTNLDLIVRYLDTTTDLDNFGGAFGDDPNNVQNTENLFVKGQLRLFSMENLWEQKIGISYTDIFRKTFNDFDDMHPMDMTRDSYNGELIKFDWVNNLFINDNNTLTFGIETEEERASSVYTSESAYGSYSSDFPEQSAKTTGIFVQAQTRLFDRLFTTAGFRSDKHKKFGSKTTFRIAPSFFIDETATKIKATYGTGFKSPTLYQLYSFYGDENLTPDESAGWDFGFEQYMNGGQLSFGAA
ncbi:TonB-dependent receptor plug domain-containing protein, partial [candidate division KSB1 bacterium]